MIHHIIGRDLKAGEGTVDCVGGNLKDCGAVYSLCSVKSEGVMNQRQTRTLNPSPDEYSTDSHTPSTKDE